MPREAGISFRILHPDPFDISRPIRFPNELSLCVEFASKAQAEKFHRLLAGLSHARFVRFERDKLFKVLWAMALRRALRLPEDLRGFSELSDQIATGLKGYIQSGLWDLKGRGNRRFKWAHKTQIMGILNVTPDSFFDGGRYLDPLAAADQALRIQQEGADWIDIGGESTRPGAQAVTASEEKRRVLPVIRACAKGLRIPLSVDTYKAEVAQAAVGEGAQMINDIGALGLDARMGKTAARLKVPVILMHMRGMPRTMQKKPVYRDVVGEILFFFRQRMAYARKCGIPEDRLLLDPGFGFGKTPWHNIELTRRLWEFRVLGRPLVFGPSRKSTLGFLLGGAPPDKRVEATGAAVTAAILQGADFVRVHDVQSMAAVVKIADALRYGRGLA